MPRLSQEFTVRWFSFIYWSNHIAFSSSMTPLTSFNSPGILSSCSHIYWTNQMKPLTFLLWFKIWAPVSNIPSIIHMATTKKNTLTRVTRVDSSFGNSFAEPVSLDTLCSVDRTRGLLACVTEGTMGGSLLRSFGPLILLQPCLYVRIIVVEPWTNRSWEGRISVRVVNFWSLRASMVPWKWNCSQILWGEEDNWYLRFSEVRGFTLVVLGFGNVIYDMPGLRIMQSSATKRYQQNNPV